MIDEILEYPYNGIIKRVLQSSGDEDDTEIVLYEGIMDEHMVEEENGVTLQTAKYVISIPLTKDENDRWIIPKKGDKIILNEYDDTLHFTVDNSEPSQIGGVSIYSTRISW